MLTLIENKCLCHWVYWSSDSNLSLCFQVRHERDFWGQKSIVQWKRPPDVSQTSHHSSRQGQTMGQGEYVLFFYRTTRVFFSLRLLLFSICGSSGIAYPPFWREDSEVSITVACTSLGCPPTLSCRLASGREVLWRWGTTCGLDSSCTRERRRGTTTCPSLLWRRRRLSSWRMWTRSAAPAWGTRYPVASSSNSGEDFNWPYFKDCLHVFK